MLRPRSLRLPQWDRSRSGLGEGMSSRKPNWLIRLETVEFELYTAKYALAERNSVIELLEKNARVQAKLLADTGRRAESGLSFLVNGLPGRVDLWRICGNAVLPLLVAEVAAAFLEAEAEGSLI